MRGPGLAGVDPDDGEVRGDVEVLAGDTPLFLGLSGPLDPSEDVEGKLTLILGSGESVTLISSSSSSSSMRGRFTRSGGGEVGVTSTTVSEVFTSMLIMVYV